MNRQTLTPDGPERSVDRYSGAARRYIAGLAILASAWGLAGCGSGGEPAAANQGPVASRASTYTGRPTPLPSPQTGNARADVFLGGIAALPDDMEMQTIIDRICRLREEDDSNTWRATPSPNASEIEGLEFGYDVLYSKANGLPGPNLGGEQWAWREEQRQCPEDLPRITPTPHPS